MSVLLRQLEKGKQVTVGMHLSSVTAVCCKLRVRFCIFVLAVFVCVSETRPLDDDLYELRDSDLQKAVNSYLANQFHLGLKSRFTDESQSNNLGLNNGRQILDKEDLLRSRKKRLSIGGLENLDLLTKTLDKQRFPRPGGPGMMSVGNMSFDKLRDLMGSLGKRRRR
ncbi:hypothetical protein CHS0354_019089 [Potamilus streckersoni]|uniref:Uncharacterized protein n=1 Tax=Potamilus streckersoni TaxID=2493646 RepID=A0AAE0RLU1_9BIVA|nr:hypothetical protein CHS0354_019089 [Potamilus streckersoni]